MLLTVVLLPAPGPGRVIIAGAAGIPASVVDLITDIGKVEARNHSGVGWALRVHVHRGEIVRAVLVRDYAGQVHYLLLGGGGEGSPRIKSHERVKLN
jgi:hypothetical protein